MKTLNKGSIQEKILPAIAQEYHIDIDKLEDFIFARFPEMAIETDCANCGSSMESYIFVLDCLDALLVYGMGEIIRKRMEKGIPFTEANAVHLQSELNRYYSVPSRSTQCAKLGLIAKVLDGETHNTKRGWLITARGWAFLRGEAVPAKVESFRNKIIVRYDETTTIDQAFQKHRDMLFKAAKARKVPKSDYSGVLEGYNSSDWVEIGRVVESKLI